MGALGYTTVEVAFNKLFANFGCEDIDSIDLHQVLVRSAAF